MGATFCELLQKAFSAGSALKSRTRSPGLDVPDWTASGISPGLCLLIIADMKLLHKTAGYTKVARTSLEIMYLEIRARVSINRGNYPSVCNVLKSNGSKNTKFR